MSISALIVDVTPMCVKAVVQTLFGHINLWCSNVVKMRVIIQNSYQNPLWPISQPFSKLESLIFEGGSYAPKSASEFRRIFPVLKNLSLIKYRPLSYEWLEGMFPNLRGFNSGILIPTDSTTQIGMNIGSFKKNYRNKSRN